MRLFRRKKAEEPLSRELAILRVEYPGQYCSVTVRRTFSLVIPRHGNLGFINTSWEVYVHKHAGVGGSTFREAMLNLKIKEGENHAD